MTIPSQMTSADTNFRKGIFNLLYKLKGEMDGQFDEIIEVLQEKLHNVPKNDFEEAKKFFFEVTNKIISKLTDHYDITYEQVVNEVFHADSFTIIRPEEIKQKIEEFRKYTNMPRFSSNFMQSYNPEFGYKLRNGIYNGGHLERKCIKDENGNLVLLTNKINIEGDLFLPIDRTHGHVGQRYSNMNFLAGLYAIIDEEKNFITRLNEDFTTLIEAVDAFNEHLQESLRKEHLRFGIKQLKQILSNIIVPVALLENDELRQLCEEHGRTVFVKTPTMDDLLYKGSSVHVYSSFDMDDDSSYIAKPITISPVLPKDMDDLKYLGIGQYTDYDPDSSRSLSGGNPYVINNNAYVKANYDDFMQLIPEELLEEMRICENLVKSIGEINDQVQVVENDTLKDIIDALKEDDTLDPQKIIDNFMATSEYFTQEEERETGPIFVESPEYEFGHTSMSINSDLFTRNSTHPNGYVILQDSRGYSAACFVDEENSTKIYTNSNVMNCIKALNLPNGIYSVYDFVKRRDSRREALKKMVVYNESVEE